MQVLYNYPVQSFSEESSAVAGSESIPPENQHLVYASSVEMAAANQGRVPTAPIVASNPVDGISTSSYNSNLANSSAAIPPSLF